MPLNSTKLRRDSADVIAAWTISFSRSATMQQVDCAISLDAIGFQRSTILHQATREHQSLPVLFDTCLWRNDRSEFFNASLEIDIQMNQTAIRDLHCDECDWHGYVRENSEDAENSASGVQTARRRIVYQYP